MSHVESEMERADSSLDGTLVDESVANIRMSAAYHEETSPTRHFGDTIQYRQSKPFQRLSRGDGPPKPGPPPTLPAPVPSPQVPQNYMKQGIPQSHSFSSSGGATMVDKRKPSTMNYNKPPSSKPKTGRNGVTSGASLHSSNDSGFSNEPPPQPEVDYSDDEPMHRVPIRTSRSEKSLAMTRHLKRSSMSEEIYGGLPSHKSASPRNMRSATSYGNLTDGDSNTLDYRRATIDKNGKVKRNKSFWRFSKSEEILEGMAMWRHRDLITAEKELPPPPALAMMRRPEPVERDSSTLKRAMVNGAAGSKKDKKQQQPPSGGPGVATRPMLTKSEIDARIAKSEKNSKDEDNRKSERKADRKSERKSDALPKERPPPAYKSDPETEIYGDSSTLQRRAPPQSRQDKFRHSAAEKSRESERKMAAMQRYLASQQEMESVSMAGADDLQDTNFYDDESVQDIMLKSIKRKDILRQYYSSGTDTECKSTSSDPYDCIVVDDHLVSAAEMARQREAAKNKKNRGGGGGRDGDQKMDFKTFRGEKIEDGSRNGTLLPRTKLSKSSGGRGDKYESEQEAGGRGEKKRSGGGRGAGDGGGKAANSSTYGPWTDLWNNSAPTSGVRN